MITAYTYTVGYPVELGELILQEACVLMDAGDTHLSTVRLDTDQLLPYMDSIPKVDHTCPR